MPPDVVGKGKLSGWNEKLEWETYYGVNVVREKVCLSKYGVRCEESTKPLAYLPVCNNEGAQCDAADVISWRYSI